MSMRSYSEVGYGFELFTGEPENLDAIKEFIIEHGNLSDEDATYLRDCEDEVEMERDVLDQPVSWKVASIINELEGLTCVIGCNPCADTDTKSHIGIGPFYPWQATEKDKALTEEQAEGILVKYANLLKVNEKPDYFDLEYYS